MLSNIFNNEDQSAKLFAVLHINISLFSWMH